VAISVCVHEYLTAVYVAKLYLLVPATSVQSEFNHQFLTHSKADTQLWKQLLWSPYVIGQTIYIFILSFVLFFFT